MTPPSTIEIASLRVDDLEAVGRTHAVAFKGYMNTRLGTAYLQHFYGWFLRQPDAICLRCTIDGMFAGFAVGAPVGYGTILNRELLPVVVCSVLRHPSVCFQRRFLGMFSSRVRSILAGTVSAGHGVSLVAIAISAHLRGRGAGAALLDAFELQARARGHRLLQLSVYESNRQAIQVYERAGWLPTARLGTLLTYQKSI